MTKETTTRSLRPAKNAAARMQEVMRQPKPEEADGSTVGNATGSATGNTDSSADVSAVAPQSGSDQNIKAAHLQSSEIAQSRNSAGDSPTDPAALEPSPIAAPRAFQSSANELTTSSATTLPVAQVDALPADPVKVAMLSLLAQPYPAQVKGDMVVTSVKIPRPIWDRLEFVRTLTGDDKQEIIAKALRLYYDHILRMNGQG